MTQPNPTPEEIATALEIYRFAAECVIGTSKQGWSKENIAAIIHDYKTPAAKAAEKMLEAHQNLPEPKSLLAEAAYTGGDTPKKWRNERANYIEGYNQALKDVRTHLQAVLAEVKEGS